MSISLFYLHFDDIIKKEMNIFFIPWREISEVWFWYNASINSTEGHTLKLKHRHATKGWLPTRGKGELFKKLMIINNKNGKSMHLDLKTLPTSANKSFLLANWMSAADPTTWRIDSIYKQKKHHEHVIYVSEVTS